MFCSIEGYIMEEDFVHSYTSTVGSIEDYYDCLHSSDVLRMI